MSLVMVNVNALSDPAAGVPGPSPSIYLQTLTSPDGVAVAVGEPVVAVALAVLVAVSVAVLVPVGVLLGCGMPPVAVAVGEFVAVLVGVCVAVLLGWIVLVAEFVGCAVLVGDADVVTWQGELPSKARYSRALTPFSKAVAFETTMAPLLTLRYCLSCCRALTTSWPL
jgi:hypothetical protein